MVIITQKPKSLSGLSNDSFDSVNVDDLACNTLTVATTGDISNLTTSSISLNGNITQSSGNANFQSVSATSLTGPLLTPAQPNITSLGVLNGVNVSGGNIVQTGNGTTTVQALSASSLNCSGNAIIQGNIGIGTSSPQFKLDVEGGFVRFNNTISTDEYINWTAPSGISFYRIFNASNMRMVSGTTGSGTIEFNTSGFRDGMIFYKHDDTTTSNRHLAFYVNGPNERVRINSNGNLGVGITNPTSRLHVSGTGNITGNTTIGGTLLANVINQNSDSATASFRATTATSLTANTVTGNGNVSAGTFVTWTSPEGVSLFRYQDASVCRMVSGPLTSSTIEFNTTGGQDGSISYKHDDTTPSNRYLSFQVNSNVERLRINSSGNVGIGTSAPTSRLHVVGTTEITGSLTVPSVSCDTLDVGTANNPVSTITYGMTNIARSTSIKKFGVASLDFTGTTPSLVIKGINSTNFSTFYTQFSTAYTIDLWIRPLTLSSGERYIFSSYDTGFLELSVSELLGSRFITYRITNTLGAVTTVATDVTSQLQVGTWTHVAFMFNNAFATNKYRLFMNGLPIVIGGGTSNTILTTNVFNATQGFCVGSRYSAGAGFNNSFSGYIDEFRVSATARYDASGFSPINSQFTSDANTVLLSRMESLYLYNSQIAPTTTANIGVDIDDGSVLANNGVYTRYGNLEARSSDSVVKLGTDTVLTNTTLGSSVTSSSLTSVGTLSSLTVSGVAVIQSSLAVSVNAIISGYIFAKTGAIRLSRTGTWTVATNGNVLSGCTTDYIQNMTYDSTNGVIRVLSNGLFRVSCFCRFSDTGSNRGMKPSIFQVRWIIGGDNTYWSPTDGQNRRCCQWSETLKMTTNQGYHIAMAEGGNLNEVHFSMEMVSTY